jgi:hypothetical protein
MQGLKLYLIFGFSVGAILIVYTKIKGKRSDKELKKVKEETELIASKLQVQLDTSQDVIEQAILHKSMNPANIRPLVVEINTEAVPTDIEATNEEVELSREEIALKVQRALNDFYKDLSAYINYKELPKWNINSDNVFTLDLPKEYHLDEYLHNIKTNIKQGLIISNEIPYIKSKELVLSSLHT